MSQFVMTLTDQQEQFSIAWVHSIASVAGYSVEKTNVDRDSIDVVIKQFGKGEEFPLLEILSVQLKCTYSHTPKEDGIHYPLKIKNYDDLRRKCLNPRILVVLHVPETVDKWLKDTPENILLHHCAYWVSLWGMPASDNSETVSVLVPTTQRFTVSELKKLMSIIAQGNRL
jgi:Domain of unknown function (DUF4365)